jgi:hypothetical protein
MIRFIIALSFVLYAMPAAADPLLISGNITCAALMEMVDSSNRQSIGIATQFMADVFYDADQPYVSKKRGGIVAPLTENGFVGLVAFGFSLCRKNPETSQGGDDGSVFRPPRHQSGIGHRQIINWRMDRNAARRADRRIRGC